MLTDRLHLERWVQRYHVSARDVFALVAQVGDDCPRAVQVVRPERLAALAGGASSVEWISEAEVESRLRLVREDHAAALRPGDPGQFSLAGAQPKTALLWLDGRWGVPGGRMPTTHILKPPTGELAGHAFFWWFHPLWRVVGVTGHYGLGSKWIFEGEILREYLSDITGKMHPDRVVFSFEINSVNDFLDCL